MRPAQGPTPSQGASGDFEPHTHTFPSVDRRAAGAQAWEGPVGPGGQLSPGATLFFSICQDGNGDGGCL